MVGTEMKIGEAEKLSEDYETKILPYNYLSNIIARCHATIIPFKYAAKTCVMLYLESIDSGFEKENDGAPPSLLVSPPQPSCMLQ